jgi:hypothetical protein
MAKQRAKKEAADPIGDWLNDVFKPAVVATKATEPGSFLHFIAPGLRENRQ